MKPATLALMVAAIAIVAGSFVAPWFKTTQGPTTFEFSPGKATICNASGCTTGSSDGTGFDSTWLGLTSACRLAAVLGFVAAGGAAALTQANKLQLGSGGTGVKRSHLLFAGLIALGFIIGSLATKPAEMSIGWGVIVTLAGVALAVVGLIRLKPARSP